MNINFCAITVLLYIIEKRLFEEKKVCRKKLTDILYEITYHKSEPFPEEKSKLSFLNRD